MPGSGSYVIVQLDGIPESPETSHVASRLFSNVPIVATARSQLSVYVSPGVVVNKALRYESLVHPMNIYE